MKNIKIEKIKHVKKHKTYLFSGVIFKMKDSYRDFSIYVDGVIEELKYFDNCKENITYRLYFDESVEDDESWDVLLKEFNKRKFTELYKYTYPPLKNGKFHDGVFGTLVRFLPLFDSNKDRDWEIFSSIDIDISTNNTMENLVMVNKEFKKRNQDFLVKIPMCHNTFVFWAVPRNLKNKKNELYIIASGFSSKITFDIKYLYNFIEDITNKDSEYKFYLENIVPKFRNDNKKDDLFIYGMDEYFLSNYILPDLEKRKTSVLIYWWWVYYSQIYRIIKENNNNFVDLNSEEEKRWRKLLKRILGKFYNENKSVNNNYNFLKYRGLCSFNYFSQKLCRTFSKEMNYIFNNNKQKLYNIPEDLKKCFKYNKVNTYEVFNFK
jgi:hypothetical protein